MTTPQPAALPECIAHVEDWPNDRTPIGLVWDVDPKSLPVGTKLYALQSQPAADFAWPEPEPATVADVLAGIAEVERLMGRPAAEACRQLVAPHIEQPAAAGRFNGSAAEYTDRFRSTHKRVTTPGARVKRRHEIADAQISVLQSVIEELRRKARETPAWERGYFSSITSLEQQVALIQSNR